MCEVPSLWHLRSTKPCLDLLKGSILVPEYYDIGDILQTYGLFPQFVTFHIWIAPLKDLDFFWTHTIFGPKIHFEPSSVTKRK